MESLHKAVGAAVTLIIVLVSASAAAGSTSRASSAPGECADASLMPAPGTQARASAAVLCLVNRERARRGLAGVRVSSLLTRAAADHSSDMVRRQYFSHVSPNGLDARRRVARVGYRARSTVGETIGWGTYDLATPVALVRQFLNSGPHRRIVLHRRFRDIGVGWVPAAPVAMDGAGGQAATLTLNFGRRR